MRSSVGYSRPSERTQQPATQRVTSVCPDRSVRISRSRVIWEWEDQSSVRCQSAMPSSSWRRGWGLKNLQCGGARSALDKIGKNPTSPSWPRGRQSKWAQGVQGARGCARGVRGKVCARMRLSSLAACLRQAGRGWNAAIDEMAALRSEIHACSSGRRMPLRRKERV